MDQDYAKRARLHIEVPEETRERLAKIQTDTGAASISEAVRRALALMHVVLEHEAAGGKVIFRNRDGSEESLLMLK
jgi:hypothetical protein